jgi:hypothetical protein
MGRHTTGGGRDETDAGSEEADSNDQPDSHDQYDVGPEETVQFRSRTAFPSSVSESS